MQRRLSVGASEGAAQHLGAEARPAHPEQDAVAPTRLAHLAGERLERGKSLAHHADDIEPSEPVVDHRGVSAVAGLPEVRVAVPDSRGDVVCARRVERYRGRPGIEVLTLRIAGTHRVDLLGDATDQLVVRVSELLDAVIEQLLRHRLHVDPGLGELIHHPVGARVIGFDGVPGDDSVVQECLDGRGRHGVHRVRADQRFGVDDVSVVGVLGAGARPEWALHMGTGGAQRREALAAEALLEQLVGEHRVGDRRLAEQALDERVARVRRELLLEQLVDERVDAAHEEGRDRVHVERLPGACDVPRAPRCTARSRDRASPARR